MRRMQGIPTEYFLVVQYKYTVLRLVADHHNVTITTQLKLPEQTLS